MRKKRVIDKISEKFCGEAIRKSWEIHMQAFGPILESAFTEDYLSRVQLIAALNKISRKEIRGGFQKLQPLEKKCVTDGDWTAWLYFMGLCFEMAGSREGMLDYYEQANEFSHQFYLPYMKVARCYLEGSMFEPAENRFRQAVDCFSDDSVNEQEKNILHAAYAGLVSCLTFMHRYNEAEEMLERARRLLPLSDGWNRSAAEAGLCALLGRQEEMKRSLEVLKQHSAEEYFRVDAMTRRILDKSEPAFFAVSLDVDALSSFWQWFLSQEKELARKLKNGEPEEALDMLSEQLNKTFPFVEREIEVGILIDEDCFRVDLPDYFSVSLTEGYKELLACCPKVLTGRWKFTVIH